VDPSSAHTTIGTFDGTNATTRAKSHTRDAPAPRHMPARPAASIKLHAFVLQSTCAHGQAKERWPNCTGHANTRQTRASHCCGTACSAAQPSRLPNYCDRARHLRDPWLHGPHCLRIGPAPQGLRAACGATCGSAQRNCPTHYVERPRQKTQTVDLENVCPGRPFEPSFSPSSWPAPLQHDPVRPARRLSCGPVA
jgi:hypothetical protein